MKKNKENISETFNTIDEIQEFWDTHSITDFSEDMITEDFELKSKLEKKKIFQLLNITPDQIREIEAAAKSENMDSKDMIRKWVLEHV
jgi:hypothetical protein